MRALIVALLLLALPAVGVAADSARCPHCGQHHIQSTSNASLYRSPQATRSRSRSYRSLNSLPAGRRYYNGRYFGAYGDRFYGPQYGNF